MRKVENAPAQASKPSSTSLSPIRGECVRAEGRGKKRPANRRKSGKVHFCAVNELRRAADQERGGRGGGGRGGHKQ